MCSDWDKGWERLEAKTKYEDTVKQLSWSFTYLGGMGGFYEEYWLSKITLKLSSHIGTDASDLTENPCRYCQMTDFNQVDEILGNLCK